MFTLKIETDGAITFIYNDALVPLLECGKSEIKRVSHVEPCPFGRGWVADLSPVGGPMLGPFDLRIDALQAETDWLCSKLGL